MKKVLFMITVLIMLFPAAWPAHALFIRAFTSLTGEAAGSVDNVDCSAAGLIDSDGIGIVITESGSVYFFYFDRSATNSTSSPTYIRCKNYSTSGVWINRPDLYSLIIGTDVLAEQTIGIADNNLIEMDDADAADNDYGKLTANGFEGRSYAEVRSDLDLEMLSVCSGITSGTCLDTDNGILYSWDGDSVEPVIGIAVPSTTPNIHFNDTTHDAGGSITVDSASADDAVMCFGVDDSNGDDQDYACADGVDERFEVQVPLTAPSIDAGIDEAMHTSDYDIETNEPNVCSKFFWVGDGADAEVEFELPADPECVVGEDRLKTLEFWSNEADGGGAYDMVLDPNGTDKISIAGSGTDCTAGVSLDCESYSYVILRGINATNWLAIIDANSTCACGS